MKPFPFGSIIEFGTSNCDPYKSNNTADNRIIGVIAQSTERRTGGDHRRNPSPAPNMRKLTRMTALPHSPQTRRSLNSQACEGFSE
jgi:hypothetical protein